MDAVKYEITAPAEEEPPVIPEHVSNGFYRPLFVVTTKRRVECA